MSLVENLAGCTDRRNAKVLILRDHQSPPGQADLSVWGTDAQALEKTSTTSTHGRRCGSGLRGRGLGLIGVFYQPREASGAMGGEASSPPPSR